MAELMSAVMSSEYVTDITVVYANPISRNVALAFPDDQAEIREVLYANPEKGTFTFKFEILG